MFAPKSTEYTRRFNTYLDIPGNKFIIEFVDTTDNANFMSHYSTADTAWQRARSQARPVVILGNEKETIMELGVVFDPEAFERSAYSGYVGYGLSMTDGYYAPEPFEAWVKGFRRGPSFTFNDAPLAVKEALPLYMEHLIKQ